MLENGSIYHSKGGFLSFSSSSKKWRQPTSHKFEGYKSIHSTQTLQDVEVRLHMQNRCLCVAKGRLYVQNRPEGCIFECSSVQRTAEISTVYFGKELVRVLVSMF